MRWQSPFPLYLTHSTVCFQAWVWGKKQEEGREGAEDHGVPQEQREQDGLDTLLCSNAVGHNTTWRFKFREIRFTRQCMDTLKQEKSQRHLAVKILLWEREGSTFSQSSTQLFRFSWQKAHGKKKILYYLISDTMDKYVLLVWVSLSICLWA